ncbi:MAG: GNAT family N-acetyltransferase [Phycisphaerales bacterium]|nr:MAG: GNAT family N-acetyltransferase [Phycisphaerales bacterium]
MANPSDAKEVVTETDRAGSAETLQVEAYDDFESLRGIQQKWDQFVESADGGIFLTYDWCRIWWDYYGRDRDLKVFLFHNNDELVGIIPLFFEEIRLGPILVRVGKIVGSDFTPSQFSLPLAKDHLMLVVQAFSRSVCKYKWDILLIGPLAGLYESSKEVAFLCAEAFGEGYSVKSKTVAEQTYFPLAGSWEEQVYALSKNQRNKFRKNDRVIRRETKQLASRLARSEDFSEIFQSFVEMHQSRWLMTGRRGHFGDWPCSYEFHRDAAASQLKCGRLRLLEVKLGDSPLGYKYGYRFGNKHYAFLDARSVSESRGHLDVGRVLFAEQIRNILKENGVEYLDSMRGRYEHKLQLGGVLFQIRSIYVCPKKLPLLIRVSVFRALAWLLNLCYYRIWYCRLAPRLPFKHRPLWKIWIRSSELPYA